MKESAIMLVLDKIYRSFSYPFLQDTFFLHEAIRIIQQGYQTRINMEK